MPDDLYGHTTCRCPPLQQVLDAQRRLTDALAEVRARIEHCQQVLDQVTQVCLHATGRPLPDGLADLRCGGASLTQDDGTGCRAGVHHHVPYTGSLTSRESQVLQLFASGSSNRYIAEILFLSPRTVERHIANVYLKLGVHSKADATAFARRNRLG